MMTLNEKQELVRLLNIYQNNLIEIDTQNRKWLKHCEDNNISKWTVDFTYGIKSQYEHSRVIISKLSNEIQKELIPNWRM